MAILESERVRLRQFTLGDVENLFQLDADPEVWKYLRGTPPPREEILNQGLPKLIKQYQECHPFGLWAAEKKDSGAFMGWFHFRPYHELPEDIELGYRLRKEFWGKGYATEMSQALVNQGFLHWDVSRAVAFTMPENLASIKVMEKVGLKYEYRFYREKFDIDLVKYGLTREEWEKKSQ